MRVDFEDEHKAFKLTRTKVQKRLRGNGLNIKIDNFKILHTKYVGHIIKISERFDYHKL